jgi:hypothetical protein
VYSSFSTRGVHLIQRSAPVCGNVICHQQSARISVQIMSNGIMYVYDSIISHMLHWTRGCVSRARDQDDYKLTCSMQACVRNTAETGVSNAIAYKEVAKTRMIGERMCRQVQRFDIDIRSILCVLIRPGDCTWSTEKCSVRRKLCVVVRLGDGQVQK